MRIFRMSFVNDPKGEKEGGSTLSFTHEKRREEEEERDKISGLPDASQNFSDRKAVRGMNFPLFLQSLKILGDEIEIMPVSLRLPEDSG